jgi:hypothetical protein
VPIGWIGGRYTTSKPSAAMRGERAAASRSVPGGPGSALRAREHLVPGGEAGALAVDDDGELVRVAGAVARRQMRGTQRDEIVVEASATRSSRGGRGSDVRRDARQHRARLAARVRGRLGERRRAVEQIGRHVHAASWRRGARAARSRSGRSSLRS